MNFPESGMRMRIEKSGHVWDLWIFMFHSYGFQPSAMARPFMTFAEAVEYMVWYKHTWVTQRLRPGLFWGIFDILRSPLKAVRGQDLGIRLLATVGTGSRERH
jgi:hypothetical protein